MADWLLLRIVRDASQPVSWVLVDAHGQLLAPAVPALGDELQTVAVGRRVALLVPGTEVSLLSASFPAGNEARLLQLAPYALEDQVSQDIDALHFALGARNAADGNTPVAVVERATLDGWLARAQELQLQPQVVFADTELAPQSPGQVTALLEGGQLILRADGTRPLVLSAADPGLALEMLLGPEPRWNEVQLVIHAGAQDWQQHSSAFEALRPRLGSLKVQLVSGGALAAMARNLPSAQAINLLQGAYRPREAQGTQWKRWRLAAALAAGLLVLHVGAQLWQMQRLKSVERDLDAGIRQIYAAAFAGEAAGKDARRRVEQRLASLSGSGDQRGGLMHLLAAVSAAHQNVPIARVEALSFKPGQLEMKLTAPDASTLEQFSQSLRGSGYTALVTSGTVRGTSYEGHVELKNPGT